MDHRTGVLLADGIVATNDHVMRKLLEIPRPQGMEPDHYPFSAHLLRRIPGTGVIHTMAQIAGFSLVAAFQPGGKNYYGPEAPDMAFLNLRVRGLPHVELECDRSRLLEGLEVATAGFPMGNTPLIAPGYLHQVSPTLQRGIIGAVLPYPCEGAHGFMVNLMTQGGGSGSPVFRTDQPKVIGLIHSGLWDRADVQIEGKRISYRVPTNYSYALPSYYLRLGLEQTLAGIDKIGPHEYEDYETNVRATLSGVRSSGAAGEAEPQG